MDELPDPEDNGWHWHTAHKSCGLGCVFFVVLYFMLFWFIGIPFPKF